MIYLDYMEVSMKKLEDFTLKQVIDYLINKIADEREISKAFRRVRK